jgi:two-component system, chemotaxis family, chemotaxis protein CheY
MKSSTILNVKPANSASKENVVLIVEDDEDLRYIVQWVLEDEGFVVETAKDGREALDCAMARKPSLVLLDMALPIIDGYGVAAGLHETYGDTITILTMTADGHAAEKAKRVGAIGYVSKPFELDTLVDSVRGALER